MYARIRGRRRSTLELNDERKSITNRNRLKDVRRRFRRDYIFSITCPFRRNVRNNKYFYEVKTSNNTESYVFPLIFVSNVHVYVVRARARYMAPTTECTVLTRRIVNVFVYDFIVSYEMSAIKYVWKNDESTLKKSPSLKTLNAYLDRNHTTECPSTGSWRGKHSHINYEFLRTVLLLTYVTPRRRFEHDLRRKIKRRTNENTYGRETHQTRRLGFGLREYIIA